MIERLLRTGAMLLSPRKFSRSATNIYLWRRLLRAPEALSIWNEYFDADEYLHFYPDVRSANVDPAMHFLLRANHEFRDPSSRFNTRYYLSRYSAVADSGLNPLLHYALFGKTEGREVSPRQSAAPVRCLEPTPDGNLALAINNDWRRDYPLVTGVVPVYNNARFLEETIRSILNQTFQNVELIIVEGGSTDQATVAEVRRLESLQFPRTTFYFRPERHHVGDNKNYGAGMARGRYVFWLDQDDLIAPVFVEVGVFLAEVYGYDLVYPSLRAFGDVPARSAPDDSNRLWLVTDPAFPQILSGNQVPNCALCRRGAWSHIGGYRDFGTHENYISEDWDFWIRYLGHGYRGISIRQCLHLYRVTDTGMTATYKPDPDEQRRRLAGVNDSLISSWRPTASSLPSVLSPYANLGPLPDAGRAVMLGLPSTPTPRAEALLKEWTATVRDRGQVLVVVTSWTTEESQSENSWRMPDEPYVGDGLNPHVYHLSWLFRHEEYRREFLLYLTQRYGVRKIVAAGCEVLDAEIALLLSRFPGIEAVCLDPIGSQRPRTSDS